MESTETPSTATDFSILEESELWKTIIVACLLSTVVIFTISSNLTVLAALYLEKKLRNTFIYYIAHLAATDFLLGVTSMTFCSIDTVLGYWPFGEVSCGVWIFFDFCLVFASTYTLVAISVDRYWAVEWCHSYSKFHEKCKPKIIIICIWIASVTFSLSICIVDRLKWSDPNVCAWDPVENKMFGYFIAVVGFHFPCVVIFFCYIRIIMLMRKQRQVRPGVLSQGSSNQTRETPSCNVSPQPGTSTHDNSQIICKGRDLLSVHKGKLPIAKTQDDARKKIKEERRVLVTMSFILIAYIICWVPFQILFTLTLFDPMLVHLNVFVTVFWMSYLNSALNPLVYAASYRESRIAMKHVLMCKFRK